MPEKNALLFAGQGAQTVGMGRNLAEQFPVAADLFREADEILGRKLSDIAWNGPIEELTKTLNCQPALYVHGLACLAALREIGGNFPVGGAAGLSLGEITAHAAAGTFDFATGLPRMKMSTLPISMPLAKSSFRVSWRKSRRLSVWRKSTGLGAR